MAIAWNDVPRIRHLSLKAVAGQKYCCVVSDTRETHNHSCMHQVGGGSAARGPMGPPFLPHPQQPQPQPSQTPTSRQVSRTEMSSRSYPVGALSEFLAAHCSAAAAEWILCASVCCGLASREASQQMGDSFSYMLLQYYARL